MFFLDYLSDHLILLDCIKLPGYVKRNKIQKTATKTEIQKAQKSVLDSCDTLATKLAIDKNGVHHLLTTVSSAFSTAVDLMVSAEMGYCLEKMTKEDYDTSLRYLTDLALGGNNICRLMVKQGVVRSLLRLLKDQETGVHNKILTLRALGCVCCVVEGIRELVVMDGLDIIVDTLENDNNKEDERREAVGVLAQVTNPWIEGNTCVEGMKRQIWTILHSVKGQLTPHHNSYYQNIVIQTCLERVTPMKLFFSVLPPLPI